jgi:NADPH:quinone reductase-like Zn-dependent oxidoreductase
LRAYAEAPLAAMKKRRPINPIASALFVTTSPKAGNFQRRPSNQLVKGQIMADAKPQSQTMKAWTCRRYGGPEVLTLEDMPKPVQGKNEALVKIHAATVTSGDSRIRGYRLPRGFGLIGRLVLGFAGPRKPVLGPDLAGSIEAVGEAVTRFAPGDAVVAFPGAAQGCHAEFRIVPLTMPIERKPPNLSFEEAASLLFGGMTALHFINKAGLKAGEKILVIGASGAVGSAMVQLARHRGAEVTAVTSAANACLAASLGAGKVIDYAREDFSKSGEIYDVIADTVGASAFAKCHPALKEHGRYLSISGGLSDMFARRAGTKRSLGGVAAEKPEYLAELVKLAQDGAFKPVIDSTFSFSNLPEAHTRVDSGHKRGSVVVTVTPPQ